MVIGVIALIVAIVGLFLASPTIFQLCFGNPQLRITFDAAKYRDMDVLRCLIWNDQLKGWRARLANRRAANIHVSFEIYEQGSDKKLSEVQPLLESGMAFRNALISLPAGDYPTTFFVMYRESKEGHRPRAVIYHQNKQPEEFAPGFYTVKVTVKCENKTLRAERPFGVAKLTNMLMWEG